ncbi:MAG TPA: polysaccharide deacetylase family protein [Longimicrobium sp.]|nr:polysaccharide deacetylase family protein [Longimicrobium sp.]
MERSMVRMGWSGWRRMVLVALCAGAAGCSQGIGGGAGPSPVAASEAGIPVLTWHGFAEDLPPRGNLTATFAEFERMMEFLARHRFRSVFPDQVRPGDDRRRMVVLTFDDGTIEQLRAAEIMERHGFRGVFFVIPDRAGRGDARYLDSAAVTRLARAGHRIAPHGFAHRSMAIDSGEVEATLRQSAALIARQAAQPRMDADFAFPFGHYTAGVARRVGGAFRYLHTVDPGYWDGASPLLPRLLLMSDVDRSVYEDYVLGGGRHRPVLRPLTEPGAVADSVAFLAPRGFDPRRVQVFAVTADADNRSYVTHPAGDFVRLRGDTAWLDLAGYMRRFYPPGRAVISYALVVRDGRRVRYLTPALLHWLREPATVPPPGRAATPVGSSQTLP